MSKTKYATLKFKHWFAQLSMTWQYLLSMQEAARNTPFKSWDREDIPCNLLSWIDRELEQTQHQVFQQCHCMSENSNKQSTKRVKKVMFWPKVKIVHPMCTYFFCGWLKMWMCLSNWCFQVAGIPEFYNTEKQWNSEAGEI